MSIEIRELIIKVTIEETEREARTVTKDIQEIQSQIVKECVEKVISKLESIGER